MNVTDFASIETEKENIQPAIGGRSAKKLSETVALDPMQLQEKLMMERREFEATLEDKEALARLDDPIEPYIEYIKWTHASYTTGNLNESGLIRILERTTHDFKDDDYYKNEIRYFKVWLEYINYSDRPGEVFKYLHKKKIGAKLALFYEKYAQFYELDDQWEEAEKLVGEGVEIKARPLARLLKYADEFQQRKNAKIAKTGARVGLLNATGGGLPNVNSTMRQRKSKIAVFSDVHGAAKTESQGEWTWNHLDSIANAKKENVLKGTSWKGQTLKQTVDTKPIPKMEVFNDARKNYPITYKHVDKERNRTEVFDFNLDMLMGTGDNPLSLVEVMSMYYHKFKPVSFKRALSNIDKENDPIAHQEFVTPEQKKIKLDEQTFKENSKTINTPTVTLTTNHAHQEIMDIFNKSLTESQTVFGNKDYDALSDGGLSDFVTETITKSLNLKAAEQLQKTPQKKANFNDEDVMSSPFLNNPDNESSSKTNLTIFPSTLVDPFDPAVRNKFLSKVDIAKYDNCTVINAQMNKLGILSSIFKAGAQPIHGNMQSLLEFEEGGLFCITRKLGRNDSSNVFLSERYDGELNALKIQTSSNSWEGYIYHKIGKQSSHSNNNDFVQLLHIYSFIDESYLVLPYFPQGSIATLVDSLSANCEIPTSKRMDEQLAIYLTIQLLRRMRKLHSMNIIHCDLNPENCMLNINKSKVSYEDIIFVDFDKSIDLSMFSSDVRFGTRCEEHPFLDGRQWKFELDYFNLANVIHTILFAKSFKPTKLANGTFAVTETIKKYWQKDMWLELFDVLLNPGSDASLRLEKLLGKFESWFNLTVEKRKFLSNLIEIGNLLETMQKKKSTQAT